MRRMDGKEVEKRVKASAESLGIQALLKRTPAQLSGGQRQRVALARALLKDPPILVLDEANSMYDLEGEAAFVEACAQSLQDRTAILITHRPATLELADRIVWLDQGIIRPER